jgi:nucleoside-diphosphate-sugar epimerase
MLLPNAKENLKIFSGVDLLCNGSYEVAMHGCSYVLHTASPFFASTEEDILVVPALEGTRNVLNTCNKLGVKKVILTSSTAAIYVNYGKLSEDHIYTEDDWSDETLLRENCNWYCVSKVAAEKLAWDMSKAEGSTFQLATINPTLVLGPLL